MFSSANAVQRVVSGSVVTTVIDASLQQSNLSLKCHQCNWCVDDNYSLAAKSNARAANSTALMNVSRKIGLSSTGVNTTAGIWCYHSVCDVHWREHCDFASCLTETYSRG